MNKKGKEKSLISVNKNSIFYKIKIFFNKLFNRNDLEKEIIDDELISFNNSKKDEFYKMVGNIENNETRLLKIQKQYDDRLIETEDIPEEYIDALIELYEKQIIELEKSNQKKREKLLKNSN